MPAELRPATGHDLPAVLALLEADALPVADVPAHIGQFVVAVDERVIGVGGVEAYGHVGLLRSICVDRSARGHGLGHRLCDAVEAKAAALGIRELYLLTTTARGFFETRGFVAVDRAQAPDAIRGTTEFTSLCPSTAACLHKRLVERIN